MCKSLFTVKGHPEVLHLCPWLSLGLNYRWILGDSHHPADVCWSAFATWQGSQKSQPPRCTASGNTLPALTSQRGKNSFLASDWIKKPPRNSTKISWTNCFECNQRHSWNREENYHRTFPPQSNKIRRLKAASPILRISMWRGRKNNVPWQKKLLNPPNPPP